MAVYSVIMAGGAGTRFWPRSRKNYPKQLLNIFGKNTLIQDCFNRMRYFSEKENIFIVTNGILKPYIQEQLSDCTERNFIIEPFGRNTAPCITLAAFQIVKEDPEGVMLVVPADHLIENLSRFNSIMTAAIEFAHREDALITIGIHPTHPETGYGYVQAGDLQDTIDGEKIYKVKTFAEKPDPETARRFLESGDFFWNSGMFIWSVQSILGEVKTYLPDVYEELEMVLLKDNPQPEDLEKAYQKIRNISIDYGVMQESQKVYMLPGDFVWNDVGSWDVVAGLKQEEKGTNVMETKEGVEINSANNYVYSPQKVVALVDVNDLIIIDTNDSILVCKRGSSQKVRQVVDELTIKGLEDVL